ncbi:hypothetical protein H1C71_039986, partial [Ictidomys tridecemlineatus]
LIWYTEKKDTWWQERMVYNQSQRKALQACFEQNPHPNKATREQLAKEIDIPESKIRVGIRFLLSETKHPSFLCSLEWLTKEAKQDHIPLARTPRRIQVQAFERNQVPDVATREKLAKPTDIQELRIQVSCLWPHYVLPESDIAPAGVTGTLGYLGLSQSWGQRYGMVSTQHCKSHSSKGRILWFQDQRYLDPDWSRKEAQNFLVDDTNGRPDLTNQLQETDLFIHPDGSYYLPSPDSFPDNQTISPTPLLSSGIMQPTQAVPRGENSDLPLTFMDHLPELLTPRGDISHTRVPFWIQFQEEYQNHKEQTGIGVIPLKDHSEPNPENKKPQGLGPIDISYVMQWWDQGRQALIEEWEPLEEIQ